MESNTTPLKKLKICNGALLSFHTPGRDLDPVCLCNVQEQITAWGHALIRAGTDIKGNLSVTSRHGNISGKMPVWLCCE